MNRYCILLLSWIALFFSAGAAEPNAATEARFLSNTRQLIFDGRRSGEGYFSPDGKALIFQSEREPENPFYQIYTLDLESGDSHRVSPGSGKTTCAFFRPGNNEVLFASTHLDPQSVAKQKAELTFRATGKERRYSWDYDEQMDIFIARRDGSTVRQLTSAHGYDAEASFSPDGKLIVFCSLRDAYPTNKLSAADTKRVETDPSWFGEIFLMNADGSNVRQLTHTPGYDGGPFFSPDGQRIVWRRFTEKGDTADVFTMRLDGSDERRLTDFGAMSCAPYFHPSSRHVIFTANKLGFANFELFLVDAEGTRDPVRVTFTDGFDGLPVFSPDGTKLAWTSNRTSDGKSQIFLADWNQAAALDALKEAAPRQATDARKNPQSALANELPKHASTGVTLSSATSLAIHDSLFSPEITTNDLRAIVAHLASDELEGRLSGSRGAELAADYIAAQMRRIGLQPVGTNAGFFQHYDFNAGARVLTNANRLAITPASGTPVEFTVEKDFRPLSFTANAEVEGEVVFVGYGLSVPGKPGEGYDSYAGVNVSNKIALVLRYVPEEVDARRRAELNRYAGVRYKAMHALEHGAKGVLFLTGPKSPNAGELLKMSSDSSLAGSALAIASIGSNVANALFAGSGRDLSELQAALDKENPHAASGMVLTNARVHLSTGVEHIRKADRNVLGMIPPASPVTGTGQVEYLMIGAHYDHLGHGETGAMNRKGEEGMIHPGADDNASGVATLLELADALVAGRKQNPTAFPRGLIFAAWAGEELGILGSSWFAEHPLVPLTNLAAYVNFDMVGRLNDNKLTLQGVASSPVWRKLIEKRNVAAGFNLTLQDDPYLPTDTTALYPKGVPVLAFFTGGHDDYHRPTDKPETLNYEGTQRIAWLARGILTELEKAERPAYAQVTNKASGEGGRESLRAYLGTIPDYATEVQGVKLSGVRAGGPADKAGLKGGDVIVEFAGTKIANIYDYTYAMDAAKIAQAATVVVLRNGERVTLSVTPEARK
ncbi:MAG: M28 family peptidase [Pedosphaera sp.]|nr:M28 family peptidase [Pedosphaera sp.]